MPTTEEKSAISEPLSDEWRERFDLLRRQTGYDVCGTAAPSDRFDGNAADLAIGFFPDCLHHIEGALAGKPFVLEQWQKAVIGAIFGWKRADGTRRFREVFLFVPRKSGKTPLAAGLALYVTYCDKEAGQQNIVAAGEKEQASLLFRHAAGMVKLEPLMDKRTVIYRGYGQRALNVDGDQHYLKVWSAEALGKHGGNLHLGVIDELHVQPNRDLVDVIQTGMASENRKNPLLVHITTSDYDRPESICNEKHEYASKVRDGVIDDPAFFPIIYEATIEDDWTDERVWEKANPNLDVSVSRDYLRRECRRAQEMPSNENTFKRLHLNIRTQQDVRWLPLERWDEGAGEVPDVSGRECFAGLDLSSTTDFSAFVLLFRPETEDDPYYVLPWFWLPSVRSQRGRKDARMSAIVRNWANEGLVELTEGDVVDYEVIRRRIVSLGEKYNIRQIALDRWNATGIQTQLLGDGFDVVPFGQGFADMNSPAKELENLILSNRIVHGGNPVLRWMVSVVSAEMDAASNVKPSKKKSTERIDGVVSMIMALGVALKSDKFEPIHGVYQLYEQEATA